MAGDGTENWRLIVEAARALTAAGQSMRVGRGEYVLAGTVALPGGVGAGPGRLPPAPAPDPDGQVLPAEDDVQQSGKEYPEAAGDSLLSGLAAFAGQFRAQADSAGLPSAEHAVHFCLALGLQAAWALPAGAIVFERPSRNGTRTDLWVGGPHDLAIEVKYLRSHASGSQPARPMHYGQLLADFNKVARVPGRLRLVVLAADDGYVRYIEQSGRSVLPLKPGQTALITPSSLGRLADTPRQKAESHGPWRDLRTTLRWTTTIRECSLFAWEVIPGTRPPQPASVQRG